MLGVKNSVYANLNQISEMTGTAALLQSVLFSCNDNAHLESNASAFILCNVHTVFQIYQKLINYFLSLTAKLSLKMQYSLLIKFRSV